jgi:hypothetical protein
MAFIAALFGLGATAATFHDMAKIVYDLEPCYDVAELFFP